MKTLTTAILFILSISTFAQMPSYEMSTYTRSIPNEGKDIATRYIGESRAKYAKRVHRVIDSRMKQNKVMDWPRNPLNALLMKAVKGHINEFDRIPAYASDSLSSTLSLKQIEEKGSLEYTFKIEKPIGSGNFEDTTVTENLGPNEIKKFRIMEDWIFDSQHSDLRPRIIAIAPLYTMKSETGTELGEGELFWVKMDDFRPILAQQEIFNKHNDAARMSYDHWFQKRMFASHIVKESNVYDLDIKYFDETRDNGVEALLAAQKIKNDLFVTEHDFWEY